MLGHCEHGQAQGRSAFRGLLNSNASCYFSLSSYSLAGNEAQDFHTLFQMLMNTNRYQYLHLAGEEIEGQRD